ncbi:MAG: hypothetical protein AABX65_03030 [Nanoarchaeota archaeon]
MKIAKFSEKKSEVTREVIAKCGEALYHAPEVSSVFIKIAFKDGSTIGFKRDVEEDILEEMMSAEAESEPED